MPIKQQLSDTGTKQDYGYKLSKHVVPPYEAHRQYMALSNKTLFISRLALLVSLTVIIQAAGLPQPITGPLINALLFITAD